MRGNNSLEEEGARPLEQGQRDCLGRTPEAGDSTDQQLPGEGPHPLPPSHCREMALGSRGPPPVPPWRGGSRQEAEPRDTSATCSQVPAVPLGSYPALAPFLHL